MKTLAKSAFLIAVINFLSMAPCKAQDAAQGARAIARVPLKVAGCMFGLAIGTPVAIARVTAKRVREHRSDYEDVESPSNLGNLVVALPMGIGEGICSGLYYGPRNAFMAEPFTKESISLGENMIRP